MRRALHLYLALAIFSAVPSPVWAGDPVPFTAKALAEAKAASRPIVIYVGANWCSTCSVQKPVLAEVLAELEKNPEVGDIAVFTVDFDDQKDVLQSLNVQIQSTIIVFRGKIEVGRSVGESDPEALKALLMRAAQGARPSGGRVLSAASYVLSILAGILSTLSPCVLPLLPIVAATAATAHRFGALALAAGLASSFVGVGLLVATLGLTVGLDAEVFRSAAAALMILVGLVLLSGTLQERFAMAGAGLSGAADRVAERFSHGGLSGQFIIGLLLGAVWSPCVGPTLGAAATLAAQHESLGQVVFMMLLFGIGAALPLSLIGVLSREALARWRRRMDVAAHAGRFALGLLLVATGGAIITGLDRLVETRLVELSPDWLARLATRF